VKVEQILNLPSIPAASPSYPHGPYYFVDREYFVVLYESDPDALRAAVPEPLEPAKENLVAYEWIKMPDASGFGDYCESGVVIPVTYKGKGYSFVHQMFLDDEAPIAGGREIWGFPKKYANPVLKVQSDTLTGTLHYGGQLVAMGTMGYKHESLARNPEKTLASMTTPQITLKVMPGPDGKPAIAQLITFSLQDVKVKGSWVGPARLHLVPHANAPVSDLPIKKIIGGRHFIADLTLPYGTVLHDYLK
jgi:acetoacetate decarboxylase